MEKNYSAVKTWLALMLCCLPFFALSQQIQWATFIDASGRTSGQLSHARDLKTGPDGYLYVSGYGRYLTFPGPPTADTVIYHGIGNGNVSIRDGFVLKMTPDGNHIIWACVIGGAGDDDVNFIEFDASGNIILMGNTAGNGFPITTDADQPVYGGGDIDIYFAKLSPAGDLLYASYFGGSDSEYLNYAIQSPDGSISISGWVSPSPWPGNGSPPSFPVKLGANQPTGDFADFGDDYFVARMNADLSFNQSTFLFPRDSSNYRDGFVNFELNNGDLLVQANSNVPSDIPTTPGAFLQSSDPQAGYSCIMVMSRDLSTIKYCTSFPLGVNISGDFQRSNGNIVCSGSVTLAGNANFPITANSPYPLKTDGTNSPVVVEFSPDLSTVVNAIVVGEDFNYVGIFREDINGNYLVTNGSSTSDAFMPDQPPGSTVYSPSIGVMKSDFSEILYATRRPNGYSYYDEQNCKWYFATSTGCGTFFSRVITSDTAYDAAGNPLTGYWLGDRTTINGCSGQRAEPHLTAINFPSITSGNIITAPASSYCINSIPAVLDGDEPVVPLPSLKIGYNDFEQNFVLHYQWQVSTAGPSGPFTDINLATGEDYVPVATLSAGSRWYRRIAIAGNIEAFPNCVQPDTSNVVEVVTTSNISHSTNLVEDPYGICPGSPINVSTTLAASPDGAFGPYTWTLSDISVDTVVLSGSTGVGSFSTNGVPAAGLFRLVATDTRGCQSADTLTVESMQIDAGPATVFTCGDASVVIGPSGPAPMWENYATNSYAWSPSTNLNNAALLRPTVSPVLALGDSMTYYLSVNGCLSDSVKVKNEAITPLPALPADTICQGDSLNMGAGITPQAGVVYQWAPGFNIVDDTDPNSKLIGSHAPAGVNTTTYYLTATAGNTGCVQTTTQEIAVYKQPNIPFDSDDPYSCFIDYYGQGPSLSLGTGSESGISYSWDVQVINISATTGLPSTVDALTYLSSTTGSSVIFALTGPEIPLGGMADGDYDLRYIRTSVNMAEPSCMRRDTAVIHYSPPCDGIPGFYCTALTPPNTCGTEGTLIGAQSVAGGLYYEWSPVAGLIDPYSGLPLPASGPHPGQVFANPDTTTHYHLSISYPDRSGDTLCTIDILVFPSLFNTPSFTIPPVAGGCASTPIQIGSAPIAGLVYSWEPTAGLSDPNISNPTATITENTTYVVMAVDTATGCFAMDTVVVQLVPILVDAGLDASYCDAAGRTDSVGALVANPAYSYQWTASSGAVTFGNSTLAKTTATIPAGTGTVTLYLTATDLNTTCSQMDSLVYTATSGPAGYSPATTVRVCDGDSVQIGAAEPPGTSYTYAWTSTSTGNGLTVAESSKAQPYITPTGAGPWTYDVVVTETGVSATSCTANYTVTVSRPTEPVVTASPAAVPCASNGVQIGVTNSPTAIWTFSWSPTDHIVSFAHNDMRRIRVYPPDTTTYTLTATYQTGCVRTYDIIVPGADYVAEISDDELELCEGDVNPTFTLNSIPAGATVAWTSSPAGATAYLNSTTANNPVFNISAAPAGTYTYTATVNYGAGCVSSASLTVRLDKAIPDIAGADQSICLGECVTIGTAAVSGLSYAWTTVPYDPSAVISFPSDAAPEVCPTQNTTYKLTYIDVASGCTFEDYVSVQINGTLPTLTVISAYEDCQNASGTATVDLNALITSNTGASTSFWLDATAAVLPVATPTTVEAGTYYIRSSDASGLCSVVEPTTITLNPIPNVSGQAVANCITQTGYLALAGFAAGDRFDYTAGMSYTGAASYATASVIPFSGLVATGLALPPTSGSNFYTVRVFNADSCSQDITLELLPTCCPAIDSLSLSATVVCEDELFSITIHHDANLGDMGLYMSTNSGLTAAQLYDFPNHSTNGISALSGLVSPAAGVPFTVVSNLQIAASGTYTIYGILANGNSNIVDSTCVPVSSVTLIVNDQPEVEANSDQTICETETVTLSGSISGGASTSTWTTGGDGGFDNPASLTAIYTPGVTDIANGGVTLTLTTDDPAGPCEAASDSMRVTIDSLATVTAGGPDTVCQSATPSVILLSGAAVGGAASTGAWSIISGGGTLNNTSQTTNPQTVSYTPAANFSGTVTLRLTTNTSGSCPAEVADRTIEVEPMPALTVAGTAICKNSSIDLSTLVTGNSPTGVLSFHATYADADAAMNPIGPVVTPGSASTYYVRSSLGNCYSIAKIPITILPPGCGTATVTGPN